MSHKFKPPKLSDARGWKLVEYLVRNGFYFDKFWVPHPTEANTKYYPGYPKTLRDAEDFVKRYRDYATPIDRLKRRNYIRR